MTEQDTVPVYADIVRAAKKAAWGDAHDTTDPGGCAQRVLDVVLPMHEQMVLERLAARYGHMAEAVRQHPDGAAQARVYQDCADAIRRSATPVPPGGQRMKVTAEMFAPMQEVVAAWGDQRRAVASGVPGPGTPNCPGCGCEVRTITLGQSDSTRVLLEPCGCRFEVPPNVEMTA